MSSPLHQSQPDRPSEKVKPLHRLGSSWDAPVVPDELGIPPEPPAKPSRLPWVAGLAAVGAALALAVAALALTAALSASQQVGELSIQTTQMALTQSEDTRRISALEQELTAVQDAGEALVPPISVTPMAPALPVITATLPTVPPGGRIDLFVGTDLLEDIVISVSSGRLEMADQSGAEVRLPAQPGVATLAYVAGEQLGPVTITAVGAGGGKADVVINVEWPTDLTLDLSVSPLALTGSTGISATAIVSVGASAGGARLAHVPIILSTAPEGLVVIESPSLTSSDLEPVTSTLRLARPTLDDITVTLLAQVQGTPVTATTVLTVSTPITAGTLITPTAMYPIGSLPDVGTADDQTLFSLPTGTVVSVYGALPAEPNAWVPIRVTVWVSATEYVSSTQMFADTITQILVGNEPSTAKPVPPGAVLAGYSARPSPVQDLNIPDVVRVEVLGLIRRAALPGAGLPGSRRPGPQLTSHCCKAALAIDRDRRTHRSSRTTDGRLEPVLESRSWRQDRHG